MKHPIIKLCLRLFCRTSLRFSGSVRFHVFLISVIEYFSDIFVELSESRTRGLKGDS